MNVNFYIRGRLGNAIFRYLACTIMCLYHNGIYTINNQQRNDCDDDLFIKIMNNIIKNEQIKLNTNGVNMVSYYQHDTIYKMNKEKIIEYINNNPSHYIVTDGVNAGDGCYEQFLMKDILHTPTTFTKKYKNVLHVRLEDFVTHNLYLDVNRIIQLLEKGIINESLCIVCKKPETEFEHTYIKQITDFINNKFKVFLEHNDTLTDYYIMKEAELLICSKSTLSWCAAFFSNNITKCYLPNYATTPNSTCKYPIDNTELY